MDKQLKVSAERVAKDYGFSSLQEAIRVLTTKFSKNQLKLSVYEEDFDPEVVARYEKMTQDIKQGKNVVKTKDVDDFLVKLRS